MGGIDYDTSEVTDSKHGSTGGPQDFDCFVGFECLAVEGHARPEVNLD